MDWGGLGGLETLDPSLPQLTPIYQSLTDGLKKVGYEERVDLFGAPYDFRLAADGLEQVCSSLSPASLQRELRHVGALSACHHAVSACLPPVLFNYIERGSLET
jgi:hypothetical protein